MKKLFPCAFLILSIVAIVLLIYYESNIQLTSIESQKSKIIDLHKRLEKSERKVYSQNNEDGVIFELIQLLDLNYNKFYVEIGTQSGLECNSR